MSIYPCPNCGAADTRVTDSHWRNGAVRRRRRCGECGAAFRTSEILGGGVRGGIVGVIRARMKERGVSYSELATRAGVARSTLSQWLTGRERASPTLATAEPVLNALGLALSVREIDGDDG